MFSCTCSGIYVDYKTIAFQKSDLVNYDLDVLIILRGEILFILNKGLLILFKIVSVGRNTINHKRTTAF